MTGLFARKRPPLRRVLLIESGSRQAADQFLRHLYALENNVEVDVLTCFSTPPESFERECGRVFLVTDPAIAGRRRLFIRTVASTPYDAVAVLHTGSKVLRKWKWIITLLTRAKILVVKENAEFFFLDYGHVHDLQVDLPHFRREQITQLRLLGEVLLMPFTIGYLLLYAGNVHLRRLLQFRASPRQQNTHGRR